MFKSGMSSAAHYFAGLPTSIPFVSNPTKRDPLSFRYYNPSEIIEGKPMSQHLPFAAAYWHTIDNPLGDPFGPGTAIRPWDDGPGDLMDRAKRRAEAFFEFLTRVGIKYWCFHCADVVPYGASLSEFHRNLDAIVPLFKQLQAATGVKLGWGTANLFSHPKFVHGSLNASNPAVFAHAAACVKKMIDVTQELGGENFVFWGGRVGYQSLWNTDYEREMATIARFFELAIAYADEVKFGGQFLIEPKAREPKSFQYDFSVAEARAFLLQFGIADRFKFNVETDHANLAGRTMGHELRVAGKQLGGVDANQPTPCVLWDTDVFPYDRMLTTEMMFQILHVGGIGSGVINFDAKARRESFEVRDLFTGHVLGMDAMAFGLKAAAELRRRGDLQRLVQDRYSDWDGPYGKGIFDNTTTLGALAAQAYELTATNPSGRFEEAMTLIGEAMDAVTVRPAG